MGGPVVGHADLAGALGCFQREARNVGIAAVPPLGQSRMLGVNVIRLLGDDVTGMVEQLDIDMGRDSEMGAYVFAHRSCDIKRFRGFKGTSAGYLAARRVDDLDGKRGMGFSKMVAGCAAQQGQRRSNRYE